MTFSPRQVRLPGQRTLVVRALTTGDVDGLAALYAGLEEEDLYRRFFQAHVPSRKVLQKMARAEERGGVGLVAEVSGANVGRRIVGECSCELLPDGDGELAITVASDWRGWLGPYLLDALVDAAADRGITNLQADVLVTNGRMLALARSRGFVTMEHSERPAIVRVVIGAASRNPTWPPRRDGARILVEAPGARWHGEEAARRRGLALRLCPGPFGNPERCPVMRGEPCPLAAGADAIVTATASDPEAARALAEAHAHLHPGIPVCIELEPEGDEAVVVGFLQRLAGGRPSGEPRTDSSAGRPTGPGGDAHG